MFQINRVEDGAENSFIVSSPEGKISIVGTSDFVVLWVKALCQTEEYIEFVRRQIEGTTKEEIAQKMRDAGFPEQIVKDFENGDFWADVIY